MLVLYVFIHMNLDFEGRQVYLLPLVPVSFLVSWGVLYWCYTKQTLKTYLRYAEDMRENRAAVPKGKGVPDEEQRKLNLWNQAVSYSYSVTNVIFFSLFLFLHHKVFFGSGLPDEINYTLSVLLPTGAVFAVTR
eukprot:TRINITY_DN3242_c0_g1_i3.p1 TRINITY_DN3242_c0_g1~~TRINITY_DN3242_c0_g1_i3.p1  ORF type:complete len:134 (-),score=43.30 TRINITY_DN3242_c0_g1_i3:51-452(-)